MFFPYSITALDIFVELNDLVTLKRYLVQKRPCLRQNAFKNNVLNKLILDKN